MRCKMLQPIDILLLTGIGVLVAGIVVFLLVQKKRGKRGCGCQGCQGCPHANACGGAKTDTNVEGNDHV